MKTKPPRFEGRDVDACALKLSGTSEDRVGAMNVGEVGYLIVKYVVAGVDHRDIREVFTRAHKGRPVAMVHLDPKDGEKMLDEASMLADERFGISNLFRGDGTTSPGEGPQ